MAELAHFDTCAVHVHTGAAAAAIVISCTLRLGWQVECVCTLDRSVGMLTTELVFTIA